MSNATHLPNVPTEAMLIGGALRTNEGVPVTRNSTVWYDFSTRLRLGHDHPTFVASRTYEDAVYQFDVQSFEVQDPVEIYNALARPLGAPDAAKVDHVTWTLPSGEEAQFHFDADVRRTRLAVFAPRPDWNRALVGQDLSAAPFGLVFGGWDASHDEIVAAFGPFDAERETPEGFVRCYDGTFLGDRCELACAFEPQLATMRIQGVEDTPEYLLDRWIPALHSTFGQPEQVARSEVKWADVDGTEITLSVMFSHHPSIMFVRGYKP